MRRSKVPSSGPVMSGRLVAWVILRQMKFPSRSVRLSAIQASQSLGTSLPVCSIFANKMTQCLDSCSIVALKMSISCANDMQ